MAELLSLHGVEAGYGDVTVLSGVDLAIEEGEVVALIGANGAGKTTTLRAISGLIRIRSGGVRFAGEPIHGWPTSRIVAAGLVQVAEGRKLFASMTVLENLEMGSFGRGPRRNRRDNLEMVYALFPRLAERRRQVAGTLSGGEQQMLAVGRALMSEPRLLMLDEPSLGLAPKLVASIFEVVRRVNAQGTTVLIVEQNAVQTLQLADRGYVLENGAVALQGTGEALLADERIREAYLGL